MLMQADPSAAPVVVLLMFGLPVVLLLIVIQVAIVRWILRINEIVANQRRMIEVLERGGGRLLEHGERA